MADLSPDADAKFAEARDNASFANDTNFAHALIAALEGVAIEMARVSAALTDYAETSAS